MRLFIWSLALAAPLFSYGLPGAAGIVADSASTIVINGKVVSQGSSRVDGVNVYMGDDHPLIASMAEERRKAGLPEHRRGRPRTNWCKDIGVEVTTDDPVERMRQEVECLKKDMAGMEYVTLSEFLERRRCQQEAEDRRSWERSSGDGRQGEKRSADVKGDGGYAHAFTAGSGTHHESASVRSGPAGTRVRASASAAA